MRQTVPDTIAQQAISKVVFVRNEIYKDINEISLRGKAKSVKLLLDFCRKYMDKKQIQVVELFSMASNHHIKSFYIRDENSIDIVYLKDLNNCWKRFALCKELWHILLADPSNYSPNFAEHIEGCFGISLAGSADGGMASTYVERAAELAAMEYLLPYSERRQYTGTLNLDFMQIADKYKAPRIYVESYLNPHTIEQLGRLSYTCVE